MGYGRGSLEENNITSSGEMIWEGMKETEVAEVESAQGNVVWNEGGNHDGESGQNDSGH